MKTNMIKLASLVLMLTLFSCKKERTCTCTETTKSSAVTVSFTETSTTVLKEVDGKTAKAACKSTEETYQDSGATITVTNECKLD